MTTQITYITRQNIAGSVYVSAGASAYVSDAVAQQLIHDGLAVPYGTPLPGLGNLVTQFQTHDAFLTALNAGLLPDSIYQSGSKVIAKRNGALIPLRDRKVLKRALFLGTSITASYLTTSGNQTLQASNNWIFWMMVTLRWPFDSVINKGVNGDNTSQMWARYAADVAANYDNFDILFFEPGPNDFHSSGKSLATLQSNYTNIITSALNAGKIVVVISPTPSFNASLTLADRQNRSQLMAWLPGFVAQYADCRLVISDDVMSDPATGLPLAALYNPSESPNYVHPATIGCQVLGRHVARHVAQMLGYSPISQSKVDHTQYMANPMLNGANASGANNFTLGTNVTGTGPDATAVSVSSPGTAWNTSTHTCVVSQPTFTGTEEITSGGVVVTVSSAPADQSAVHLMFGSNYDGNGGTSNRLGLWDDALGGWAATTAFVVGDHRLNPAYPGGIWKCLQGGTSGSTIPAPITANNYGQIVNDGTVVWQWQKIPAAGDQFVAQIEYEITALTGGGVSFGAQAFVVRNDKTDPERFGLAAFPNYDNGATPPAPGYPGSNIPRIGTLRSEIMTLTQPQPSAPINVRYVEIMLDILFKNATSATIFIKRVDLIKVN